MTDWALARALPDEAKAHAARAAEELRALIEQSPSSVRLRRSLNEIERFLASDGDDDRPTNKRL